MRSFRIVRVLAVASLVGVLLLTSSQVASADLTAGQRAEIIAAKGALVQTENNMNNVIAGVPGGPGVPAVPPAQGAARTRAIRTRDVAIREWDRLETLLTN
jgi:hypothetical protein